MKLKVESLSRCVSRIEQKMPLGIEQLMNDFDIQDIITLNLERAVQQCIDIAMIALSNENAAIPRSMSEAFEILAQKNIISADTSVRMKKAVGFRNIAVHAYRTIDWEIVWKIITVHLNDFRTFASEILSYPLNDTDTNTSLPVK